MIISLLTCVMHSAAGAQPLPPKLESGTVVATYSYDFGYISVIGADIHSGATLSIDSRSNTTLLRTPDGAFLKANTGESGWTPSSDYEVPTLTQQYPTLPFAAAIALYEIPEERLDVRRTDDGGWEIDASLVAGNIGLTARGYEPPDGPKDRTVRFVFDRDGVLLSTAVEGGESTSVHYIETDHPALAPIRLDPSSTLTVHAEIYPEGRPDLFTPEAALERSMRVALEQAEARQRSISERLATPAVQEQLRESNRQALGKDAPSSLRWPIILTGVALITLAIIAVLRRRA
jgi:hypothetical protein